DTNDLGVLHRLLRRLTEALGRRLRRRGLAAGRLALRVEYADYDDDARSVPLAAEALDGELWEAAKLALALAMRRRTAVRTVTRTADRLVEADAQLELFVAPDESENRRAMALQRAVDRINCVNSQRSTVNGNRPGRAVPVDCSLLTVDASPRRNHSPERTRLAQPLEVPPGEEPELGNRLLRGALVAGVRGQHRDGERPVRREPHTGIHPHPFEPAGLAHEARGVGKQPGQVGHLGSREEAEEVVAERAAHHLPAPERVEEGHQLAGRGGVLPAGAP